MAIVLEPGPDHRPASESSDRSFGFVFAGVFAIVGLWPLISGTRPRSWALGLAVIFALVSVVIPILLHPLNRTWLALGRLLHRFINPLVMAAHFFLCVPPIAWL